jgi:hypothetical protein
VIARRGEGGGIEATVPVCSGPTEISTNGSNTHSLCKQAKEKQDHEAVAGWVCQKPPTHPPTQGRIEIGMCSRSPHLSLTSIRDVFRLEFHTTRGLSEGTDLLPAGRSHPRIVGAARVNVFDGVRL